MTSFSVTDVPLFVWICGLKLQNSGGKPENKPGPGAHVYDKNKSATFFYGIEPSITHFKQILWNTTTRNNTLSSFLARVAKCLLNIMANLKKGSSDMLRVWQKLTCCPPVFLTMLRVCDCSQLRFSSGQIFSVTCFEIFTLESSRWGQHAKWNFRSLSTLLMSVHSVLNQNPWWN